MDMNGISNVTGSTYTNTTTTAKETKKESAVKEAAKETTSSGVIYEKNNTTMWISLYQDQSFGRFIWRAGGFGGCQSSYSLWIPKCSHW